MICDAGATNLATPRPAARLITTQEQSTLLVTGLSGYVGQGLARHSGLASFGRVVGTYLHHPVSLPGHETCRLDLTDAQAVDALWEAVQPTVVIHTAANFAQPASLTESIVAGTQHVVAASAKRGVRLVHLSSDVIFDGEHPPYAEDASPHPITPYARAKAQAETIVRTSGLADWVMVRTSLVTGLAPVDPRTQWVWDSVRARRPITLFTDEYRCPVWVEDLAGALLELAQLDFQGVLNVAGPQRLSRYQFGVKLCAFAGLDPAAITAAVVANSGLVRPRDCTLDIRLAQRVLRTRLRSVDEGLLSAYNR